MTEETKPFQITPEIREYYRKNCDPKMVEFAENIKKRLRKDWDCIIVITGESGKGKSVFATELSILIDDKYQLDKNISFIPEHGDELETKFKERNNYEVLHCDEAVRSLHKHNWQDRIQQNLIKFYDTNRYKNVCTLLLVPRFFSLSEHFRAFKTSFWIDIIERGRAIVYAKIQDKDADDVWHIKENQKVKAKHFGYKKITEIEIKDRLDVERRLPNYVMDLSFPDLDPQTKEEYIRLKEKSREYESEETDKRTQVYLWRDERCLKLISGLNYKELKDSSIKGIATYINMDKTDLSRKLKGWRIENGVLKQKDKDSVEENE